MLAIEWEEADYRLRENSASIVVAEVSLQYRFAGMAVIGVVFGVDDVVACVCRHVVRHLAGNGTSLAAEAAMKINCHSITCHN